MRSIFALAILMLCPMLYAQQPNIVHAQLTNRAADHGLSAELTSPEKTDAPQWVGYSVPTTNPFNSSWGTSHVSYL